MRFVATAVLFVAVAACAGRGPVGISEVTPLQGGRVLDVAVDSCHGDPEVEVVESDEAVTLSVMATDTKDDCQDLLTVPLDEPLGDRVVRDGRDGELVGIRR